MLLPGSLELYSLLHQLPSKVWKDRNQQQPIGGNSRHVGECICPPVQRTNRISAPQISVKDAGGERLQPAAT